MLKRTTLLFSLFLISSNIFGQGLNDSYEAELEKSGACFHENVPHVGIPNNKTTRQKLKPFNIEEKIEAKSQLVNKNILQKNDNHRSDLWQEYLIDDLIDNVSLKEIISQRKRSFEIGMKILFISVFPDSSQEPSVDLAKIVFQGRGIPYDHFVIKRSNGNLRKDMPLFLDKDGNPKYYAIVLSTSELGYSEGSSYQSAFSDEQWETLVNYERTYNIRRVSLYSYPNAVLGVKLVGGNNANPPDLIVGQSAYNLDKSLIKNSTISLKNDWHYQAKITESNSTREILSYNNQNKTVAAITKKLDDGREQMHFFFTQGQWVKGSLVLAQTWLNWVTHGTYLGNRRVYLNVHIDDFFLATNIWDPNKNIQTENNGKIHRLSPEDFEEFTRWQHFNFRPLSKNNAYRVEFAFNGHGTIIWKPKSSVDPLLTFAQKYYNQYFWMSHTYTHADLNFTTYQQTDNELKKNIEFTKLNFLTNPDFINFYSTSSMVTPKISGLLREEPLHALWDNGIKYVTGDNTRAELRPPHPFTARYTTKELNGFPGILIIPRNATEIYYNTTMPIELVAEYNFHYTKLLHKESTFEDIYDREAERVSNNLFKYDASAHMFHQSNMNVFTYHNKKYSLLSYWMERVVKEFRKYNTLPILNLKMDDLKDLYLNRMSYEQCEVNAAVKMHEGEMQKIILKSAQNNCFVPITSPKIKATSLREGSSLLQSYGPDTNAFVKMGPESKNIEISL